MDEDNKTWLVVSSWFRVKDEDKYETLMSSLTSDRFVERDSKQSEEDEGTTLHRFSCRGKLGFQDEDPKLSYMPTFYRRLGDLLPYEDDTVTIKEIVVDNDTLEVEAFATVLSQRFFETVSLSDKAKDLASMLTDRDSIF